MGNFRLSIYIEGNLGVMYKKCIMGKKIKGWCFGRKDIFTLYPWVISPLKIF